MPAKLALIDGGHARSEKVSFRMSARLALIDGRACKIGGSFISYAHETNSQKWTGMQDQEDFIPYAHETKSQKWAGMQDQESFISYAQW